MQTDDRIELRKRLTRRLVWKVPLILALVTFAAWWQWRQEANKYFEEKSPSANLGMIQKLAGSWQGEVAYPGRGKFTEQFMFHPEGDKLFGTASYLGVKHGIEEGRIDGAELSFFLRFAAVEGDTSRERKNHYRGVLVANEIRLNMQDDHDTAQLAWSLVRK
ncbi:MAG: hypothetical protein EXR70_07720 [Deltaproteobacteria bacterium]|nr:hypothetical protein [Deltaproteobacteria bacterium]